MCHNSRINYWTLFFGNAVSSHPSLDWPRAPLSAPFVASVHVITPDGNTISITEWGAGMEMTFHDVLWNGTTKRNCFLLAAFIYCLYIYTYSPLYINTHSTHILLSLAPLICLHRLVRLLIHLSLSVRILSVVAAASLVVIVKHDFNWMYRVFRCRWLFAYFQFVPDATREGAARTTAINRKIKKIVNASHMHCSTTCSFINEMLEHL